jgi:endonuclease YncB( thermonuclease family)
MSLLLAAATVIAAGQPFTCTPTRVWDGEGPIWCAEGPRIRLSGIAAREADGSCRTGQPCPDASSEASRDALVRLVGQAVGRSPQSHILVRGPAMCCVSEGGSYERTTA